MRLMRSLDIAHGGTGDEGGGGGGGGEGAPQHLSARDQQQLSRLSGCIRRRLHVVEVKRGGSPVSLTAAL